MVGELEPREVGRGVLEVDDDELLVLVGGLEERGGLVVGEDAEDVAILSLVEGDVSYDGGIGVERERRTSPWAKTSLSRMVLAPP